MFERITKPIQQGFERQQEGKSDLTPLICGYYGRACRHMDDPKGACAALCVGCPLAEFASWYATVQEDENGIIHCTQCNAELTCDENGDMPELCPSCGFALDWNGFNGVCVNEDR